MKEIKELFYQPKYIGVDLVDTIGSLIVHLSDGTLKFQEGWGKDRIEKGVLSGQNVDKFKVEPVGNDGTVQIILQYRAQAETRKHKVGITNQLQQAEAWVKTANEIYNKRWKKAQLAHAAK